MLVPGMPTTEEEKVEFHRVVNVKTLSYDASPENRKGVYSKLVGMLEIGNQASEQEADIADSRSNHHSCEIERTTDAVGDIWCDFSYIGRCPVDLPQVTDATNEAELQLAYEHWTGPSGKVVNEVVANCVSSIDTIDLDYPPPAVFIFDKDSQSMVSIAAVIDLTDPSEGDPPPSVDSDRIYQLTSYLRLILDLTPGRTHIYGILTNHCYLVCVKAQRAGSRVEFGFKHAGPYREDFLQWILHASLTELGVKKWEVKINGQNNILKNYLHSREGTIDFQVDLPDGRTIVARHFADPETAMQERVVGRNLKGINGVTQLANVELDDPHFVALAPVGLSFNTTDRSISEKHVECLRRALRAMHRVGLAHCKVKGNIYFVDDSHALLSDWSGVQKASALNRRHDFMLLYSAVEAVGGSVELKVFALDGKRLRVEEGEEVEEESSGSEDP